MSVPRPTPCRILIGAEIGDGAELVSWCRRLIDFTTDNLIHLMSW